MLWLKPNFFSVFFLGGAGREISFFMNGHYRKSARNRDVHTWTEEGPLWVLQAVLQGWSWDLAGKMSTSFIIPMGCPCPVALLSFQNSPTKLAKIHYQTAVAPACNTTTSQHHFTPSYHACLTYRSVLLPPLSLHHGLTMGEGRKSVTNCFSCLFPPVSPCCFPQGHAIATSSWLQTSQSMEVLLQSLPGAPASDHLGIPKLPGFSERGKY